MSNRFWCAFALALPACLAACCAPVPRADKYFDRGLDPLDAMRMFQYAVETKQYDIAFESLTPLSREKMSYTQFQLFFRFGRLEELSESPYDVISDAVIGQPRDDPHNREYSIVPISYANTERGVSATVSFYFRIVGEGDDAEWLLDLTRTGYALSGH